MNKTKFKGDVGLTQVIADLTKSNYNVSLPIAEHLKYDLIAEKNGILKRFQVKYSSLKDGCIRVNLASAWSSAKSGNHVCAFCKGDYDIAAVYCPDMNGIFYIDANNIIAENAMFLRVDPPKQTTPECRINWAKNYQNCDSIYFGK